MNDPSFVLEDVAFINMRPSATSPAASKPNKVRLPRVVGEHFLGCRDFFSRTLCCPCRRGNHKGHKKYGNRGRPECTECIDVGLSQGRLTASICATPSFETYVQCLEMLGMMSTSDPNPNTPDSNSLVAKIFAMWGSALLDQTEAQSRHFGVFEEESKEWIDCVKSWCIFPTTNKGGGWRSLQDSGTLVVNDRPVLADLFQMDFGCYRWTLVVTPAAAAACGRRYGSIHGMHAIFWRAEPVAARAGMRGR